jgi:hypothetical protein
VVVMVERPRRECRERLNPTAIDGASGLAEFATSKRSCWCKQLEKDGVVAGILTTSRGLDDDGETEEGKGRMTAPFKMGMASSVETSRP